MDKFIWWLKPGEVAGMMMPWLSPERRLCRTAGLNDFDDELPKLKDRGIESVVSLLNLESDKYVYESAGFNFLCCPVPDFGPPTMEQTLMICNFIDNSPKAVAVHCEGGLGRTGTVLAAWLILKGATPDEAIIEVRKAEPGAIESNAQFNFLGRFHEALS